MNPILSPVALLTPENSQQASAVSTLDASLFAEALQAQISEEDQENAENVAIAPDRGANPELIIAMGQGVPAKTAVQEAIPANTTVGRAGPSKTTVTLPALDGQAKVTQESRAGVDSPSISGSALKQKSAVSLTKGDVSKSPSSLSSSAQQEVLINPNNTQAIGESAEPFSGTQTSQDDVALPAELLAKMGISVDALSTDAVSGAQRAKKAGGSVTQKNPVQVAARSEKKPAMSTESFLDLRAPLSFSGKSLAQAGKETKNNIKQSVHSVHPLGDQTHLMLQGAALPIIGASESAAEGQIQLSPKFVAELGNAMTQIAAQPSKNGEIRIRMNPEHLGEVRLFVKASGDQVSVRIDADNPAAKALFEGSVKQLEAGLAGQNLILRSVEVGSVLPGATALRMESPEGFRETIRFDSPNKSQDDQSGFGQAGKQGGNAHERYNQRRELLDERLDRIA